MSHLTTTDPTTTDLTTTAQPAAKRRRLKALLAGGCVLGVGAAVTLAAWNDSEFGTGDFASGSFNLEGSTDGATYDEHSASPGADLPFTVAALDLTPTDTVYAPFAVRLDDTTRRDANVTITATPSGTVNDLTYQLISTTGFACEAGTTGTDVVPAGTPLGTVAGPAAFTLDAAPSGDGVPVNLCYKVTAGEGFNEAQTGDVTWQFEAVSL